jgi:hypothetical protein
LLDLFQAELQLIGIKPLRTAPEPSAPQLMKQVTQPLDLLDRMIACGDRSVSLGNQDIAFSQLTAGQLAQRFDVVGEEVGVAHARSKIRFAPPSRVVSMCLSQRVTDFRADDGHANIKLTTQ